MRGTHGGAHLKSGQPFWLGKGFLRSLQGSTVVFNSTLPLRCSVYRKTNNPLFVPLRPLSGGHVCVVPCFLWWPMVRVSGFCGVLRNRVSHFPVLYELRVSVFLVFGSRHRCPFVGLSSRQRHCTMRERRTALFIRWVLSKGRYILLAASTLKKGGTFLSPPLGPCGLAWGIDLRAYCLG